MNLKDEVRSKIRSPHNGGWRELAQGNADAQQYVIELVGEAIRKGKSVDKLVSVLDQVMSKRQHINDVDLLIILREV